MRFKLTENNNVIPFPRKHVEEPQDDETYDVDAFEPAPDPEPEDFGPEIAKRMRFTLVPNNEN
jgi:hypothetical protein